MKKTIALILALLMLVSCGCGAVPTEEASYEEIGNRDDLVSLATTSGETRVGPSERAYINGGDNANKNWRVMNQEAGYDTNTEEILLFKYNSNGEYRRDVLFTFPLAEIAKASYTNVFFVPSFTFIDSSTSGLSFSVYKVKADSWDTDTVTYNNAPAATSSNLLQSGVAINALCTVNLTAAVKAAIKAGETELSIRLVETSNHTAVHKINPKTTYLVATTSSTVSSYNKDLLEDASENKAIWEYAQDLFDDWNTRYQTMKNWENYPTEKIVSDEDEFSKTVYSGNSGFGNWTLDNVNKPHATRTYGALDDLGDYTDYDNQVYDFDVYGGWMNPKMRQEATGYFHTAEIDGRKWLIDPLGYPCYVLTMSGVAVNYLNSPHQKAAALRLYGTEEKFLLATVRWLKDDLGFNGGRSLFEIESPFVVQGAFGVMSSYGSSIGTNSSVGGSTVFSENNTMNVFDPGFVTHAATRMTQHSANVENPWVLGYTTDNELPMDEAMLDNYLKIDPTKKINGKYVNLYSYAAAWTWFVNITGKANPTAADITDDLRQLFRGFVYDRYFKVIREAFDANHPNHLLLGCRFLTKVKNAPWVLRFSSLYLDAMTINWYGQWTPSADDIYEITKNSNVPLMVTEFYTKALENDGSFDDPNDPLKNTRGAGWIVRTQQDRADFYQNFTLRLIESKNFVGWQWHQYLDDDDSPEVIYETDGVTWRDQSNIDANKGIVNNWHEPYEELCSAMAEINKNAYRLALHFDAKYAK